MVRTYRWHEHELPRRDSQKSRLYAAEQSVFRGRGQQLGMDIGTIQLLVDGITESKFWSRLVARSGHEVIRVRVRQGRKGSCARGGMLEISLPDWAKTPSVLLHELAHSATPGAAHHWPFAATFLELVRHYMGEPWHLALKAAFKAHGVCYRPKRKATEAQREAGRRLAACRRGDQ